MQGFSILGDCMLPTIHVILEINTLGGLLLSTFNYDFLSKFPYNFCRDDRQLMCMLQGTPCDMGFPCSFYGGKVCSVL